MTRTHRMPVDVFANDDGLVLVADLPGVAPDALDVSFDKGMLTVSGTRNLAWNPEEAARTVQYQRRFQVPDDIDAEQVSARLEHGVLVVNLPKAESAKPRRIPIHSGS